MNFVMEDENSRFGTSRNLNGVVNLIRDYENE